MLAKAKSCGFPQLRERGWLSLFSHSQYSQSYEMRRSAFYYVARRTFHTPPESQSSPMIQPEIALILISRGFFCIEA